MELQNTELLNQLNRYCPALIGENKFIATWFGKKIKSLSEDDFFDSINNIIAEVCLITGLETYDQKTDLPMYKAQMKTIAKFILNGYSGITGEEIVNAFYLNLQGKYDKIYVDYGKRKINCEFIGQVLTGYINYKIQFLKANEELEFVINPPEDFKRVDYKPTAEDILNNQREIIELAYQHFLQDPEWNCHVIPDSVYSRLVEDGFLDSDIWKVFERKSKIKLAKEKQFAKMRPSAKEFNRVGDVIKKHFDNHGQLDKDIHQIRNGFSSEPERYAKQLSVLEYFKYRISTGVKNIYQKE